MSEADAAPADAGLAAIRPLLERQPVAALATLHRGAPAVSMVPFALVDAAQGLAVHVSRLATHTADMLAEPQVALLVTALPGDAPTPLALPRLALQGRARACEAGSAEHAQARAAYLAKLPDAEPLFDFPDFMLFLIEPESARWVAGFGRATSLVGARLRAALEGTA